MTRRRLGILLGLGTVALIGLAFPPVRRLFHPLVVRFRGTRTIQDRVDEFVDARARIRGHCERAGLTFPPARVTLLGLKDERRLEVYGSPAGDDGQPAKYIVSYPFTAASGVLGPKLREGDKQVPEGVYPVELLNPNSRFHVALRVGYPNAFDRAMGARDGRTQLGGDIMIHGGAASIGCVALGDPVAEELFLLAEAVGIENVTIVLAPLDLRTRELPPDLSGDWRDELYAAVRAELRKLPRPPATDSTPD